RIVLCVIGVNVCIADVDRDVIARRGQAVFICRLPCRGDFNRSVLRSLDRSVDQTGTRQKSGDQQDLRSHGARRTYRSRGSLQSQKHSMQLKQAVSASRFWSEIIARSALINQSIDGFLHPNVSKSVDQIFVYAKHCLLTWLTPAPGWVVQIASSLINIFALLGVFLTPFTIDGGILFFFAVGSTTELAVFMAGWGSNNKFSMLGAMRAIAQMISYELPLIITVLPVVMVVGSLIPDRIVAAQAGYTFGLLPRWFVFTPWGATAFI